jgi:mannosyltransferase OCH1-like enzyme
LDRIQNAINKAVMKITSATISDMWRLALILEHGGIYVDSTTFTI